MYILPLQQQSLRICEGFVVADYIEQMGLFYKTVSTSPFKYSPSGW